MDIKLKSFKYAKGTKAAAVIIVWLCIMSIFGCGVFMMEYGQIFRTGSYFETYGFNAEYSRLIHNVVELKLKLISEENIKASAGNVKDQNDNDSGNAGFENTVELSPESEAKLRSPKMVDSTADDAVSEKLDRLNRINKRLESAKSFWYLIKNTKTGETFTNVKVSDVVSFLKVQHTFVFLNQWYSESNLYQYQSVYEYEIRKMLSGTSCEVYAAVIEPITEGDVFYNGYKDYAFAEGIWLYVISLLIASVLLLVIGFIYLLFVAGRSEKNGEVSLSFVDRIYTDIHTLMVFVAAVIATNFVDELRVDNDLAYAAIGVILGIAVLIGMSYILSMARQFKKRQIIKNSLLYKLFCAVKALLKLCFSGSLFKVWILVLLVGYGLVNCILFSIMISSYGEAMAILISFVLFIAFNIAAVYFAAKSLFSLTQVMMAAKEISMGNLDYSLDLSKISVSFYSFAENIHSIQGGLKKAVEEAVRGERMKTDLITNVSHDLKTPLTSIINYVDLLKKEDLNNEKANGYVNILDEKSLRLKQLIEDLVEASKASSGNLSINPEKVDLHQLVMQACGEYEEKLRNAELDVRINSSDKTVMVLADGKHMWRIAENLISNVLKYSMPNSRVYINISKAEKYGVLTIKNMSAFPLDIPAEQLTERFVRGDVSRSTEGSGLGLSIAQSLTNIQGGRFKIEIDGDLFKVIVEIPLSL